MRWPRGHLISFANAIYWNANFPSFLAHTQNQASPSSPERKKPVEQFEGQDIPLGATTTNLPEGVLYKVRSTYKYVAEDADELNFEAGEIIHVIVYDDPEEQEEGWLMGKRENSTEKGLFPANFTRPI